MRHLKMAFAVGVACWLPLAPAWSKPIAWADSWTFMAELGGDSMREAQLFYAPRYWYSVGAGALEVEGQGDAYRRRMQYARINFLPKRWNLPGAQANAFTWGGLGRASGSDVRASEMSSHVGVQLDYETRRIYAAFKAEHHDARQFSMHGQTLQLGWAPYAHDYKVLATWFVFQVRDGSRHLQDRAETAYLLRLFKRGSWVDAGLTDRGELQLMLMFNY